MVIRQPPKPGRLGAVACVVLAAACAEVIGMDGASKVTCVADSDCRQGFICIDFDCRCEGGCAKGGGTGVGSMNTSAGGSSHADAGQSGHENEPGAGAGGRENGGSSSGGSAEGGSAGGLHESAGKAGMAATDGSAGTNGPSGGMAGQAGAGPEAEGGASGSGERRDCDPDARSCLKCAAPGVYVRGSPCTEGVCQDDGVCFEPHSCNGSDESCASQDCCLSLPAWSGTVSRGCDDCGDCPGSEQGFPATVSSFELDAFEVTVARFRAFVGHYPDSMPSTHSGANPHNASDDPGWEDAWTQKLPSTQQLLLQKIGSEQCPGSTWTDDGSGDEALPMNCIDWYLAQAFCIWDEGRLPTEAEWDYMASGGGAPRTYPWSQTATDEPITSYANYHATGHGAPLPVGSFPLGAGPWGHFDLAGNVSEWVWDGYTDCFSIPAQCRDCGKTSEYETKVQKGGSFDDPAQWLEVAMRFGDHAASTSQWVGLRCARNL
jgi:sulfatase modifying factor 1